RPEVVHRRPEDPLLRELANRRPVEILAFLEVNPVVIAPVPEGLTPEVGVAKTLEMALRAAPEVVREDLGVRLGGPVILWGRYGGLGHTWGAVVASGSYLTGKRELDKGKKRRGKG